MITQGFTHFTALHAWWVARRDERAAVGRKWAPVNTTQALARQRMDADKARTVAPDTKPDEGTDVSAADFAVLQEAFKQLPPAASDWFKQIVREAKEAGVGFQAQQCKTLRRYEIYRGLIKLATGWGVPTPGIALGLVEEAIYPAFFKEDDDVTLGHAIGSMNADEASTFSKLVDAYVG